MSEYGLNGKFFIQKMRQQDEKIRYDFEADMSTKTITEMIGELAKIAEQKDKADRAKAASEEAAYKVYAERKIEDEAWEEIIAEAAEAANDGVVDAGDIIDEICHLREQGMSAPAAKRMIRSIISRSREVLEEIQKAAPKPAAYGSWA